MNKFISEVTNEDCMEGMARYPDKYFDLAIVDPPYGIGEDGGKNHSRCGATKPTMYTAKNWDSSAPKKKYFDELLRVSKNTIIWGANHFIENIPHSNSSCWIVWDKQNGNNDFADCELAWTNYKSAVRKFEFRWAGMLQGDMKNKETRIHPTQKPVSLFINGFCTTTQSKVIKYLIHIWEVEAVASQRMKWVLILRLLNLILNIIEAQEKRYKAHIAQLKLELI
jgi:hypothetical protein